MITKEIFQVALNAIRANKLRSFLTMLGIIIGVGAVITMVGLGTGAQKSVQDRIASLGPDLISVLPGQSMRMGVATDVRVSITVDDADALRADARQVRAVVPELSRGLQVEYGSQNINVNVVGTTADYADVKNYTLTAGRMFSVGDDEARRTYAVLGSAIPDQLGANAAGLVGTEVRIRGISFEVLGILAEKGSQGFQNPDEQILIPLQTARYRVMGTDRLRLATVQVADMDSMNVAILEVERVLRREHKMRPGMDNDFQIRRQADLLATLEDTTKTFTRLLGGIAAVSLIVGGIGIMNIMLVSVTERTREIGVRKALGATRFNILLQFLVEALVLCLVGGTIGIVLGSSCSLILAALNHWNMSVSLPAIAIAFGFCGLVGVLFGMWPAKRAADMNPILALRYE